VTAAPFLDVRPRKYLIRDINQAFWLTPMSVFPIFIKASSNLLALTCVPVDLEDVKEKNQIPNLHQTFIKPTCVNLCVGLY
jgi:PIN domain nuclease of toxin-antitoxin system